MSLVWHATNHHPAVDDRELKRFLRFPVNREFEPVLEENARWARAWFEQNARPWCQIVAVDAVEGLPESVRLRLNGPLALVAASAGPEAEAEASARWSADEPDRYFFLESLASAVVSALVAEARRRVGAAVHFCPGYRGWSVQENVRLLEQMLAIAPLPGPLTVMETGMLNPRKSQLAVCAPNPVATKPSTSLGPGRHENARKQDRAGTDLKT